MSHAIDTRAAVLLLAPLVLVMLAFFLFPTLTIAWTSVGGAALDPTAYREMATSTLIRRVLSATFEISLEATAASLVLGYAMAIYLMRQPPRRRALLMILVMLPFWTSILVKSFAFTIVLGDAGLVNTALRWISGGAVSVSMLFNRVGVLLGMMNFLLPFMVLPIFANLLAQDPALRRAAETMGAGPVRIFWRITLPLSLPGVLSGVIMSFALSVGSYITPALLGGRTDMMMANLIDFYTRQTLDWPMASAVAMVLLAITGAMVLLLTRVRRGDAAIL
ncbi:binding-protein-dependent transport systems inner membrane component [Methylobacterium sp. 4-46]|uniref:ABC transporter permease n=1 Tax=unclassified Methylobacterium TaxID=2615210 RepID=UPI000152D822|nr:MULTISPECIES: ABC transporter permease [Methylobacterium]ACA18230.1 binding-protein-dependent transport systems inner membrane component [Methylobacterium sp. 4-46]WFT77527.1 ABC transporter permease [Methylobacterium nodulans]